MILKSLELQGFKSFPDKTRLTFDRGTTVVVGPNGSGKSNISDAMKWVLGEISSKSLRGNRMEDVIFGGTDTRRQMGFAEVSVTLDNTDPAHRLATDYEEVTVTRRYYRSGDSEYFINAKPVRLRDIHELFMNTGVGREGYSIIGQGKIAEIISRKSEERRSIFEEAAGIAKYKYKKQEAEKKLLSVDDNLTRITDIVSELGSRVGPLEKESAKAREYLTLYEQKKQSDIALWLYDMQALKAEITRLSDAYRLSQQDYERACEALEELETRSERLYEVSQEKKAAAEALSEQITSLGDTRAKLETQCKVLENEIGHLEERIAANKGQGEARSKALADAEADAKTARETRNALTQRLSEAEGVYETARAEEDACDRALDAAYARLSALNDEIAASVRAAGDLKAAISALDSTDNADARRQAELSESRKKYEENIAQLEERSQKAKEAADKYREKTAAFEAQAEAARSALADIREKKQNLEARQNDLFLDYSAKKNRIDALSRMEELFEGYSRSVRFVMSEYEKGKLEGATLYGPLSKLITVAPKYVTAIETALGAAIQNIAVEDENSAKAAILYLKKNNAGRATFYPVKTMRPSDFNYDLKAAKAQAGYVGLAHTLVSYDPRFDGVIRSLLGRILVCDNIDHAAELARAYDYRVRVVTLDGQQVNAGGSFTGGSVKHDSGMLTRTVEMDRLRAECKELSASIDKIKEDLTALDKEAKKHSDTVEAVRVNCAMINTLAQAEITQESVFAAQLEGDREMLRSLEEEEAKLLSAKDAFREEYERLSKEYKATLERDTALQEERVKAEGEREALSRAMTECQRTLSRHQVRLAELRKDLETAEDTVARYEASIVSMQETSAAMEEESTTLAARIAAHRETVEANTLSITETDEKIRVATAERDTLHAACLDCEQKATALRAGIKEQTHTKELLFQTYTKAESHLHTAQAEQDKKVATLWDEYELTYSAAALLEYPPVTEDTRTATAAEVSRLRSRIKALGPVNVSAIEEYTRVKERFDFMTGQVEDLTRSKEELSDIIYRLEGEMRERFSDAMREINHNFQIVFKELFGGGHAELILSEPDNILESGIEINVAPPGKIIKNLMLLSGGEQAFVAIALYFALLKVNPSPFCILDEIEAALDEVNVDKFADYLRRNAESTQFIVITHRRGTMEIADRLYGVTMVEKGISTVLSIRADEVGKYLNTEKA